MANLNVTEVTGFKELNQNLKRLDDRVKRTEIIKIQRRLAKPVVAAYRVQLPEDKGTLRRSVGVKAVPRSKSSGNPVIRIAPGKRGKNNAYYKFMVVRKGVVLGSRKRGSRKGKNNVVTEARDRTLRRMESGLVTQSEAEVTKYVQRQIDRLSNS